MDAPAPTGGKWDMATARMAGGHRAGPSEAEGSPGAGGSKAGRGGVPLVRQEAPAGRKAAGLIPAGQFLWHGKR